MLAKPFLLLFFYLEAITSGISAVSISIIRERKNLFLDVLYPYSKELLTHILLKV
jgi:hypothetical protein